MIAAMRVVVAMALVRSCRPSDGKGAVETMDDSCEECDMSGHVTSDVDTTEQKCKGIAKDDRTPACPLGELREGNPKYDPIFEGCRFTSHLFIPIFGDQLRYRTVYSGLMMDHSKPQDNDYYQPGCYRLNDKYRTMEAENLSPQNTTYATCTKQCTEKFLRHEAGSPLQRYQVYALLRGGQCYCTPSENGIDDDAQPFGDPVPSKCCCQKCGGDSGQRCGGKEWYTNVVRVGCHTDELWLILASVPFLSRIIFDGLGALFYYLLRRWFPSCMGTAQADPLLVMGGDRSAPGFTMMKLCSGDNNGWDDARRANNDQSKCAALVQGLARLFLGHWLQPVLFIILYVMYAMADDMMDTPQKIFGAIVALRELVYFMLVTLCVWFKPAFLLVHVGASTSSPRSDFNSGGSFLAMYLMAPEKFVAAVLFQERGLGTTTQRASNVAMLVNQSVRTTAGGGASEKARRNCFYYIAILGGALMDLTAVAALLLGSWSRRIPWPRADDSPAMLS